MFDEIGIEESQEYREECLWHDSRSLARLVEGSYLQHSKKKCGCGCGGMSLKQVSARGVVLNHLCRQSVEKHIPLSPGSSFSQGRKLFWLLVFWGLYFKLPFVLRREGFPFAQAFIVQAMKESFSLRSWETGRYISPFRAFAMACRPFLIKQDFCYVPAMNVRSTMRG